MRYASHLFLRVEPALPAAVAAAARSKGIGRSEFIRRAVRSALHAASSDDGPDAPPPAAPVASMRAAA